MQWVENCYLKLPKVATYEEKLFSLGYSVRIDLIFTDMEYMFRLCSFDIISDYNFYDIKI